MLIEQACLIPYAAGNSAERPTVDIFNAASGIWSTAQLSAAKYGLAATSLPNVGLAIFAGGGSTVDIFNAISGRWSTAVLSTGSLLRSWLAATSLPNLGVAIFAGGQTAGSWYDVVDIFNVTSGDWSTAVLSVARAYPAAASLPDLGIAIFAGGWSALC